MPLQQQARGFNEQECHQMHLRQATRPAGVVLATAVAVVTGAVFATPAWAHVEISADNPQAGARDVTLTFTGEAESDSAGIISERVILPAGISPQDVRLAKAPAGWKLTANADGYTVGGTPLRAGQDAVFSVTIAELPADATELTFKTLETYSDGKVSRWIEVPQSGAAKPDNPAPVLKLKPAAAPAPTTPAPSSAAPTTPAPTSSTTTTPASDTTGSSRTSVWIIAAVAVIAAIVGGGVVARRRRQAPTTRP